MQYLPKTKADALEAVRNGTPVTKIEGIPSNTIKSWVRRVYGSVAILRRKRNPVTVESLPGEWR